MNNELTIINHCPSLCISKNLHKKCVLNNNNTINNKNKLIIYLTYQLSRPRASLPYARLLKKLKCILMTKSARVMIYLVWVELRK